MHVQYVCVFLGCEGTCGLICGLCNGQTSSPSSLPNVYKQGALNQFINPKKRGDGVAVAWSTYRLVKVEEGPEGKKRYSSTLSLTSALDAGEWSTPRPGRFTPLEKTRYPLYRRLVAENLATTGIRSRTVQPVANRYTD